MKTEVFITCVKKTRDPLSKIERFVSERETAARQRKMVSLVAPSCRHHQASNAAKLGRIGLIKHNDYWGLEYFNNQSERTFDTKMLTQYQQINGDRAC